MNNNFNLQKYLIENKLTTNSKLLKEVSIKFDTRDLPRRRTNFGKVFKLVEGPNAPIKAATSGYIQFGLHSIEILDAGKELYKYVWNTVQEELAEIRPEEYFEAWETFQQTGNVFVLDDVADEEMSLEEYSNNLGVGIWIHNNDYQISFYRPEGVAQDLLMQLLETFSTDPEAFTAAYEKFNEIVVPLATGTGTRDLSVSEIIDFPDRIE